MRAAEGTLGVIMTRWLSVVTMAAVFAGGPALAQLRAPSMTDSTFSSQELVVDIGPNIGLRGWVGGRPGMLATDGLQASSMVLADWYPLSNGLRVSGGFALGAARFDAPTMSPLSASSVSRDMSGVGSVDPRSWLTRGSPYLGLGWELAPTKSGLYMSADLGVMYQRSSLAAWGCPSGLPIGVCGPEARGAATADEARLAPMMSLGVGLRF